MDIYILYLLAMIDFFSGDMDAYDHSATEFEKAYDDFVYGSDLE